MYKHMYTHMPGRRGGDLRPRSGGAAEGAPPPSGSVHIYIYIHMYREREICIYV